MKPGNLPQRAGVVPIPAERLFWEIREVFECDREQPPHLRGFRYSKDGYAFPILEKKK